MLGTDLLEVLTARVPDDEVRAVDLPELDITDPDQVASAVAGVDVVVNCAAFTDVDGAETNEAAAFTVNAVGPATLARACAESGAWLLHISTDYVFAGDASEPYPEDAPIAPRSAYGRTKAAGEWAVRAHLPDHSWILRTAWLYGWHGAQLRRHHPAPRRRTRHPRRRRRPARPTHLDRRPRPPHRRRRRPPRTGRHLPRHLHRPHHLAPTRPDSHHTHRRRPDQGPPHHHRRVPPPRTPPHLVRPRPPTLGVGRPRDPYAPGTTHSPTPSPPAFHDRPRKSFRSAGDDEAPLTTSLP